MKNFKVISLLFILLYSGQSYSSFLEQGERAVYNFNSGDFTSSPSLGSDGASFSVNFNNIFDLGSLNNPILKSGLFGLGESIQVDYYTNIGDANPFETNIWSGSDPELSGFGRLFFNSAIPWIDLEGSIVLTMLMGEVDLGIVNLSIFNSGIQHSSRLSVAAVPVPAAAWLFGSALLGFFGFSRRKANV